MIGQLLWGVPVAIVAVGVWRPSWALYVFVASLPFFGSVPGGPNLTQASVSVLTLGAVATARGRRPDFRYRWCALAAGAWLVTAVATLAPWPRFPADNAEGVIRIIRRLPMLHGHEALFGWAVLAYLLLGLIVAWSVLRLIPASRLPQLAAAICVGVVLTVVVGVLGRSDLIDLWGFRPSPRPLDDPRFQSLWADSRRLAEYLILAWPMALAWGRIAAARGRAGRWLQALFYGTVLLALAWSLQRGAWITLAVQVLALVIADRSRLARLWRPITMTIVVVTLLVALVPSIRDPLLGRASDVDDSSRIHYARVATDLFLERPVLGWGVGSWAFGYDERAAEHGQLLRGTDSAHGLLTQIAAERGLLGVLAFALLLATLAVRGRRTQQVDVELPQVRTGLAVSGVGLITYGVVQYLPYLPALEWLLWTLAAMWIIATDESPTESRLARWTGAGLVTATLIATPFQRDRSWQHPPRVGLFGWEWSGVQRIEERQGRSPTHRWISDYVAVEIPRHGDWLSFTLIDGHPRAAEHPATFKVLVDGELVLERSVPDRWHRCRVRAPGSSRISTAGFETGDLSEWDGVDGQRQSGDPAAEATAESVLVELLVEPAFRPFRSLATGKSLQRPRDIRRLGLVLGNACDAAVCWDDAASRRRAREAGMESESGCFPDQPPRMQRGAWPGW